MFPSCSSRRPEHFWQSPLFAALLAAGATIVSSWILRSFHLPAAGRLAVALFAVSPSIYLMRAMYLWTAGMDELQRRIQAEALSIAFTGAMLLALAVQYLQKAGFGAGIDWDFAWGAMTGLYLAAYFVVSRRYA
jgi:hypothetical protein